MDESGRKPHKPIASAVSGALLGGASGALIGASFNSWSGAVIGAIAGALYVGTTETITDIRRKRGAIKPFWHRLIVSTIVGAGLGAFLGFFFDAVLVGSLMGALIGLITISPVKFLLALGTGLGIGFLAAFIDPELNPALIGGVFTLTFQVLIALYFKGTEPVQLAAERVPAEKVKYVVPYEARTRHVGARWMEDFARDSKGTFRRNLPGIGLIDSLESLGGPEFEPGKVDPLIREFYEHTSRFRLSIEPAWNPFMKPFFKLFRNTLAQPIGQANLPLNMEEAQRGVVSYIDTIDYPIEQPGLDPIRTLRGWVRAYEDSGEAIYVGIYTVLRHEGAGFVSVGFPLPDSNFTVTLLPYNHNGNCFLLKTQNTGHTFPGHYLTFVENDGALTVLKLPGMGEEIEVYLEDGRLKTDHRFFFGGIRFLTLYYHIERI